MGLITKEKLNRYAVRRLSQDGYRSDAERTLINAGLAEFSEFKQYDIFLCHSSLDAKTILGLKEYFSALGLITYIDWYDDPQLDRSRVNKETANTLRRRMKNSKCLFFSSSDNSSNSKWMPWECGYFDGIKSRVAICPITTESAYQAQSDTYSGQEYLGLYPYVTYDLIQNTNQETLWIHNSSDEYISLNDWLNGRLPSKRR